MDNLEYFLGIEVSRSPRGMLLTQTKYINDLLNRNNMDDAKPVSTPMCDGVSLSLHDGIALSNPLE